MSAPAMLWELLQCSQTKTVYIGMRKKDYYETLGVRKGSSDDEIKKAYRRQAMKYHPDRNKEEGAEERFKEIKEAYETLIDPKKKSMYDQYGPEPGAQYDDGGRYGFESFTDTIGDFFGEMFERSHTKKPRRRATEKGNDVYQKVEVSLEEASSGKETTIQVHRNIFCSSCRGSGSRGGSKPRACSSCGGCGTIRMSQGFFSVQQTCSICGGEGYMITQPCSSCDGSGRMKERKRVIATIPKGMDSGMRVKLSGYGDIGSSDGSFGDLYIEVIIKPHPFFERKGGDLYCDVPVKLSVAALGGSITIPTLEGMIAFSLPEGTQNNRVFRIKGKGMFSLKTRTNGDLYIRTQVEVPVKLDDHQKNLLRNFNKTLTDSVKHYPVENIWLKKIGAAEN